MFLLHPSQFGRGKRVVKKGSSRSCVHKWSCSVSSKEWGRVQSRKESRREEKVVLKKTARWRLRKKRTTRKKLEQQKKSLQKQLRDIEKFTDTELMVRDRQEEMIPSGQWLQCQRLGWDEGHMQDAKVIHTVKFRVEASFLIEHTTRRTRVMFDGTGSIFENEASGRQNSHACGT